MPMARTEQVDWYDTPRWYDMVFDPGTRAEARFVLEVSKKHGRGSPRRVLEPACGSGRLVVALAREGVAVEGFDLNPRMLEAARAKLRRRGLRAGLHLGDMRAVPRGPACDAAHCLVSTFKYILDEDGALEHLRGVAARLREGGVYALGVHVTDYARPRTSVERWTARRGATEVVCVTRTFPADRRARTERVRTRLTVTRPGGTHRQETNWTFRTYSVRQILGLVRASGVFDVAATYDFHHDADDPRPADDGREDVVLVLKKRG